jgi:uncharacterized protein (TIGR03086 family)
MSGHQLIARAAAPVVGVVRSIRPEQLDAPTPCAEFDVRRLVNHLLFWGPSLEAAARKEEVPPPSGAEADVDLTRGDWAGDLVAQLERTAAAWGAPGAWEGTTCMGGPQATPAATVGGMVLGELVVHGWDLARATGQTPSWDDDVLEQVRREVETNAELGRSIGIYGPQTPVPEDAPLLHRVLGLTGRDPIEGQADAP